MAEGASKRWVFIGDTHCGHHFGLTPPDWWYPSRSDNERISKIAKFQRALWAFYTQALEDLKPIDVLSVGGDAIDGKGERSGGVEQLTADRVEQCDMAAVSIDLAEAKQVRLHYGTRYHTGLGEDFEQLLVEKIACRDVKIQGHGFYNVNGCVVDIKHKVGSSGIPHGRTTALARAHLWNQVWADSDGRQPRANIIVRHHVHYFSHCGGRDWLAFTAPALCYGSAYGIRECEGVVDVGMVCVDIDERGGWSWRPILAEFSGLRAAVESL